MYTLPFLVYEVAIQSLDFDEGNILRGIYLFEKITTC